MLIPFIQTDGGMYMEKQEKIKTILGIALLYTIITSIFSFINRLSAIIIDKRYNLFLQENALFIVVAAVIIIILFMYLKKLNKGAPFSIIGDSTVRVTAGILVAIDGIITLSMALTNIIMSIKNNIQVSQASGEYGQIIFTKASIVTVISIVTVLFQILVGIYLAKFYKSKTS